MSPIKMKPYVLYDLEREVEGEQSEFVGFFDASPEDPGRRVQRDIEDEARKVFEDAFAQGEKAGYEVGMKKVDPLVRRINSYIAGLTSFRDELVKKSEKLSVELALTFAEAIVLKECEERREIVMEMARRAMELCEDKSQILIKIRAEDARHIAETNIGSLKVVHDDTLKEPGFIIETAFGDIDGRISTQIEELKKEFLNGRF
ncbi:MAG TPA: FliH/SctL family protein [Syntrophorhabdaceae bacterium]|nr:FliH/SctL family protein [Syntrophorhabdaceae bacterium]HNT69039.1 FliH/SctL family protein [Syntrophorhabdaceae bacterium]